MEMILASCQAYGIMKTTRLGGQQGNYISFGGSLPSVELQLEEKCHA